jgi:hypothetical protein
MERTLPTGENVQQTTNEVCETALHDAKAQLHPLLRTTELRQLDRRNEFTRAFKLALEQRIAQKLVLWQPAVRAVFQFDESWFDNRRSWDGSIHLLLKVPSLLESIRALSRKLDTNLLNWLTRSGIPRFQERQSILEIQQVTIRELMHGVGYGAMFSAAYSIPKKVWPAP